MNEEDKIWRCAKEYRQTDGNDHLFPRFLFVPYSDISSEVRDVLRPQDMDVLELDIMEDKERVFDVVYDRTSNNLDAPLRTEDRGRFLIFKKKNTHDEKVPA